MWFHSGAKSGAVLTSPVSADHRFRILVVGKVCLCNTQAAVIDATLNRREALGNHRLSVLLSEWTCRCVFGPISNSVYSTFLCLKNKVAQAGVSDINLAFRPDDNHHLIAHESAGLEPGDAQGLRAIRDFMSNRTDPSCAAAERLHAIW
jgi:hypothetical protein